jgi:hypothetical protein
MIRCFYHKAETVSFISSGNYSTCFGWHHHQLSGAQTTVSTVVWQIPDAVETVVCTPDNWWCHPKHVEQFPDKINCVTLHLVGYILEHCCEWLYMRGHHFSLYLDHKMKTHFGKFFILACWQMLYVRMCMHLPWPWYHDDFWSNLDTADCSIYCITFVLLKMFMFLMYVKNLNLVDYYRIFRFISRALSTQKRSKFVKKMNMRGILLP